MPVASPGRPRKQHAGADGSKALRKAAARARARAQWGAQTDSPVVVAAPPPAAPGAGGADENEPVA